MPPITCPECGEQNLVFFRSSARTSTCRECGADLPGDLGSVDGRGLTTRVIEESRHDLRRLAPSGAGRTPAPPR